MKACVLGMIVWFLAAPAMGDIIEWRDANGVRHFTNVRGEVPGDYQESAQVVVNEVARRQASHESDDEAAAVEASCTVSPRRAGRRASRLNGLANAAYDPRVEQAYDGNATAGAGGGAGGGGGGVVITGPLAVAVGGGNDGYAADGPPYGGGYWGFDPYYYPLVTTSFDNGRSRHLTLRMLLQDQFAIDRAGPYMYVERLIPPYGYLPFGPRLSPVLARGLPNSVPIGAQVITR